MRNTHFVLFFNRQSTVQSQYNPAMSLLGVGFDFFHEWGNLIHSTEEYQHVAPLVGWVLGGEERGERENKGEGKGDGVYSWTSDSGLSEMRDELFTKKTCFNPKPIPSVLFDLGATFLHKGQDRWPHSVPCSEVPA